VRLRLRTLVSRRSELSGYPQLATTERPHPQEVQSQVDSPKTTTVRLTNSEVLRAALATRRLEPDVRHRVRTNSYRWHMTSD